VKLAPIDKERSLITISLTQGGYAAFEPRQHRLYAIDELIRELGLLRDRPGALVDLVVDQLQGAGCQLLPVIANERQNRQRMLHDRFPKIVLRVF
jgi:hypothetical protein